MGLNEPKVEVPEGDVKKGASLFKKKCAACHTVEQGGSTKSGPNLHQLFGRPAGAVEGFTEEFASGESENKEMNRFLRKKSSSSGGAARAQARKEHAWDGRWYSEANASSGIVWTDKHLMSYLEDPRRYVPGTKMVMCGIKSEKDRGDLIEYMRQSCGALASGYGCPYDPNFHKEGVKQQVVMGASPQ